MCQHCSVVKSSVQLLHVSSNLGLVPILTVLLMTHALMSMSELELSQSPAAGDGSGESILAGIGNAESFFAIDQGHALGGVQPPAAFSVQHRDQAVRVKAVVSADGFGEPGSLYEGRASSLSSPLSNGSGTPAGGRLLSNVGGAGLGESSGIGNTLHLGDIAARGDMASGDSIIGWYTGIIGWCTGVIAIGVITTGVSGTNGVEHGDGEPQR